MPLILSSPHLRELEIRSAWRIPDAHVLARTFRELAVHPTLESFSCWEFAVQEDMTGLRVIPRPHPRIRKFAYAITYPTGGENLTYAPFNDAANTVACMPTDIPLRSVYGSQLAFMRATLRRGSEAIEFSFKMPPRNIDDPYQELTELSEDLIQDVRYSPRIVDLLLQRLCRTNTTIRDVTLHIFTAEDVRLRLIMEAISQLKVLSSVRIIIHCKELRKGIPQEVGEMTMSKIRIAIRESLLQRRILRDFDASWFDGQDYIPAGPILQDHEDSLASPKAILALCAATDIPRVGFRSPIGRLPKELLRLTGSMLM
jgi:hypothetical protein